MENWNIFDLEVVEKLKDFSQILWDTIQLDFLGMHLFILSHTFIGSIERRSCHSLFYKKVPFITLHKSLQDLSRVNFLEYS